MYFLILLYFSTPLFFNDCRIFYNTHTILYLNVPQMNTYFQYLSYEILQGVSLLYLCRISKAKNCCVRDGRICFSFLLDHFAC